MTQTKEFSDFGPFRVDLRRRVLLRNGEPISLPGKAFDVLVLLLENAGSTVTKDDLLKAVWPDAFVEEGNLTQTVFLLRKALGDSDSQPLIVTVPRHGYRFVGNITPSAKADLPETPAAPKPGVRLAIATLAAGLLTGALITFALRPQAVSTGSQAGAIRFEVPWEDQGASPLLSPNGKRLALVRLFQFTSGNEGIWVREMNGTSPYRLAGTENATFPFWSADSCCLAFFAHGKLKTVNVSGGPVKVIADAPMGRGGAWNQTGTIIFAPTFGPLHAVASAGGASTPITSLDASKNHDSHRYPAFLDDGKRFLYLAHSAVKDNLWIQLGQLGQTTAKPLMKSDSQAVFVPDAKPNTKTGGLVLYVNNQVLLAQPFDTLRGQVTGEPRVIAKGVEYSAVFKTAAFSASATGILAYRTGQEAQTQLRWFSRQGAALGEVAGAAGVWQLHLSRDGAVAAASRHDPETGTGDIWTFDLNRGGANRVTRHPAWEAKPVLSPDHREVVFSSDRQPGNAFVKSVEGSGPERPLVPAGGLDRQRNPYDWSSDGKFILFAVFDKNNEDLWVFQTGTRREYPLVQGPFNESQGQFSTDGKWVAYTSDETGKPEVYVREFLPSGQLGEQRTKLSVDGGAEPRWRQDGKEIFYIAPGGALMAAPIEAGTAVRAGKPFVLFTGKLDFEFGWHSNFSYAVAGNGQKFLLVIRDVPHIVSPITVVLNGLSLPIP